MDVLILRMRAITAKKDVDDLAGHVECGEQRAAKREVKWSAPAFPCPGAKKEFVLAPETAKEQGHPRQGHHTDRIRRERQRHVFAETTEFANVLTFVCAVNHGTSAKE